MEPEQVSQLYRRIGPLIYRRCLRLLGNPESARDAMQEVFMRTLRHTGKLPESDKECLPWMYRVTTNYCLNQIRNSKRLEFRQPEDLPEPSPDVAHPGSSDRWLAAREQVLRLLAQVDKKTQQIVVLAHMDGMTQEEIAQVTGISRKTIGKKLGQFARKAQAQIGREQVA